MSAGDRYPFDYPGKSHARRHTPPTFREYRGFKDYLRDEFVFTCVYCLTRETWNLNAAFFGVEHFRPKSRDKSGELDYANLLYACNECNRIKGVQVLAKELHPEENPYGPHLKIQRDGTVVAITKVGERLVRLLRLSRDELNQWRRKHYDILEEALRKKHHPRAAEILRAFFGWPPNMPDFNGRNGAVNPYATRPNRREWF